MKEYWIVDPEKREVELLIPEEGRYEGLQTLSINDILQSYPFGGIEYEGGKDILAENSNG